MCDVQEHSVFNDYQCLVSPKNYHQSAALVTIGYLSYDMCLLLFFVRDYSALSYQTYIHHIFAISAFYIALIVE